MQSYYAHFLLIRSLLKSSIQWLSITIFGVVFCLLIGQLIKLRRWLWPIPWSELDHYGGICTWGSLILLEAALPLMSLIAMGLSYAQFKRSSLLPTWMMMGGHPFFFFIPACLIGCLSTLGALWIAHNATPYALNQMQEHLLSVIHYQWFQSHTFQSFDFGGMISFPSLSSPLNSKVEIWIYWSKSLTLMKGILDLNSLPNHLDLSSFSLHLDQVSIWSEYGKADIHTFKFDLDQHTLFKDLKMLGPPNSLYSNDLDFTHPHQAFTGYKRWSLPFSACIWSLIGATLGLMFPSHLALLLGGLSVGGGYGILRSLELSARFHNGSPLWAAWSPILFLGGFLMILFLYLFFYKEHEFM